MTAKHTSRYAKFAIYFVVLVLINIVGLSLFFRIDLTGNKVYSLSKVSKEVVHTLSEPLTINVFFTKNLPAPYNTVERYLKDVLGEYALYGGKNFNYRFYDVTPEDEGGNEESTENRKMAQDYGLYPVQIQAIEKDEVKFKKAYMGLVILHGDMMERIPTITSTDGIEYKITTSIMKLNNKISALLKLDKPVSVKFYYSPSLNDVAPYMGLKDMPQLTSAVKLIVENLNKKMYNRLMYSSSEPGNQAELEALVKSYNLIHFKWPNLDGTDVKAGEGIIGMIIQYGESTSVLPMVQVYRLPLFGTRYNLIKPDELEETISQTIETLIGINESIGYLDDHGTLQTYAMPGSAAREPLTNFSQLVSQNYSLKKVNLGETGIPKSLRCLVIASPTQNFTDYELFQIDQALMQGTNLALFLDKFQEVQLGRPGSPYAQSQFVPVNTGLEKLLDSYGVKVGSAIVLDEKCYKQRVPVEYGGGQQDVYFAPIIEGKYINDKLEYMKNIKSMITLAMSPLEVDEKRMAENKIKAQKLFSSSDRGWEMRDNIVLNPMQIRPPSEDRMQSKPLAYLLEGDFKSYFTGKPIPEKLAAPEEQKVGGESKDMPAPNAELSKIEQTGAFLPASTKPGKIFLIGSSHMLTNNLLDGEGQSPNSTFIMNMIDVLNDRMDISLMRSKTLTINPLEDIQIRTKVFIKTFNIAVVPSLVVGFGLMVWARRRYRKKRIELMFSKRGTA